MARQNPITGGSTGDPEMDKTLNQEVTRRSTAIKAFAPYAEGASNLQKGWSGIMHMFAGKPTTVDAPKAALVPVPTLTATAKKYFSAKRP